MWPDGRPTNRRPNRHLGEMLAALKLIIAARQWLDLNLILSQFILINQCMNTYTFYNSFLEIITLLWKLNNNICRVNIL